jgi:hypothetical protein
LNDTEKARVYETWQLAMAKCMTDLGFDFQPTSYDAVSSVAVTPFIESDVRRYGYHLPPGSDQMVITENDKRAASDESYRSALLGSNSVDTDGCRGRSYTRVYDESGSFGKLDHVLGQAEVDATITVDASSATADLNRGWSSCMKARGFDYPDPFKPLSLYAAAPAVTDIEKSTRLADLRCRASVRYELVVSRLVSEEVDQWVRKNSTVVDEYRQAKLEYLKSLANIREQLGLPNT